MNEATADRMYLMVEELYNRFCVQQQAPINVEEMATRLAMEFLGEEVDGDVKNKEKKNNRGSVSNRTSKPRRKN